MFAPPAPPPVFAPTAKGSGSGTGSRVPSEPRKTGEPECPAPSPDKDEN
ncbi:hypothetical protein [Nocardiopsis tropica]|uniref:Uncharacterized protein n=1 Tax=Nocardiopsis tropica TaxID=109330 RepID=A0ABV1ZP11_9ACTN